ncbi:MAG: hypothetical protein NVS2B7_13140 [Herpetosiphon sp.]
MFSLHNTERISMGLYAHFHHFTRAGIGHSTVAPQLRFYFSKPTFTCGIFQYELVVNRSCSSQTYGL